MSRKVNFNPGPSALPLPVLEQVREELLDYRGAGLSVMEMSHRSPEFEEINNGAASLLRELLGLGNDHHVVFLGGGASLQFAMVPMSFLAPGQTAAYVDTGTWASKAIEEAGRVGSGRVHVAASSKERKYAYIPDPARFDIPAGAAYVHITSNNTIYGTEYAKLPDVGSVPLVCDMSSDIASRLFDYRRCALIYAGAQKNLGPAGVTVVLIRDDFLRRARTGLPSLLSYAPLVEKKSLYNTPPTFPIYVMKLVLEWIRDQGGLPAIGEVNRKKKDAIYGVMDAHADFFRGTADRESRSWMNVTLRLPSEELEKKFVDQAKSRGLVGLKGHRSVGGIRVSLYNAVTLEGVQKLVDFMLEFRRTS